MRLPAPRGRITERLVEELARRRFRPVADAAVTAVALVKIGRRSVGGARYFPPSTALFAPLWILERGVRVWAALAARLNGACVRLLGGFPAPVNRR